MKRASRAAREALAAVLRLHDELQKSLEEGVPQRPYTRSRSRALDLLLVIGQHLETLARELGCGR